MKSKNGSNKLERKGETQMKAIILAAGYATRLYPLTLDRPKALLEVAGKSIIDYIVEEIETIDEIDEIIVISNHKFYKSFDCWKDSRTSSKKIKVIDDGTTTDEDKLGAIGDIELIIRSEKIDEDVLIIAGDNLFTFRLLDFYEYYKSIDKDCILVQSIEKLEDLKRMAVVLLDENNKVLDLEEKPSEPKSNIAVYASYIYKKETLKLFKQYIEEGNIPDAPGYFPAWLHKRKDIYAFEFTGECYDIGTHESYREVQEKFGPNSHRV